MAYDLAYSKRWRYDRDRGIARTVDVGPARAHLEKLRGSRMSWRAISEVCGVAPSALCSIGLGRTQTINPDRAARILAVRPNAAFVRTNVDGFVPAIGARRRIRALLVIGWTHASICTAAGLPPMRSAVILSQAGDFVALATHDRIAAAYDELAMRPGPSARNRRLGYPPPLAWDDIDDPEATPDLGAHARGFDLDEWMHLVNGGTSPDEASARCNVTTPYVKERARAHHRGDVIHAIAQHLLASSSHGLVVDHAESLLAEARAA